MRRRGKGRQWTVLGMAFGALAHTVVELYPGSVAGRRALQTAVEQRSCETEVLVAEEQGA